MMVEKQRGHLGGLGDETSAIAQAIYQMEGSGPTTIATRNNNPGNLRSGPGQIGTNGGFAVFPDMATGWAALDNQIESEHFARVDPRGIFRRKAGSICWVRAIRPIRTIRRTMPLSWRPRQASTRIPL